MPLWFWKQSHFCAKQLVFIGIQLIKEHTSIVNGLTQFKQSEKTLYKQNLTKILKIRFFDHHPVTSKQGC